jgi:hypothetical protein
MGVGGLEVWWGWVAGDICASEELVGILLSELHVMIDEERLYGGWI